MENAKDLQKIREVSDKSAGSAMQEQAVYMDSLQGRINALKETWKGVTMDLADTSFLKNIISGATGALTGVKKLIDTFGTLPTVIGSVVAGLMLFSDKFRKKMEDNISVLGNLRDKIDQSASYFKEKAFNISGGKMIDDNLVKELDGQIEELRQAFKNGEMSAKEFADATAILNEKKSTDAIIEQTGAINNLKEAYANGEKSVLSYGVSLAGLQGKLLATKVAMVGVKVAGMALEATLSAGVSLLASFVIEKAIEGFGALQKSIHMTNGQLEEFNTEYNQSAEASTKQLNEAQNNLSKIESLKKQIADTKDEEKRAELQKQLIDLQRQMADTFPETASGLDEEGKRIATNNDLIKQQIALKQQEAEVKALDFAKNNKNSIDDLNNYGDTIKKFNQLKEDLESGKSSNSSDDTLFGFTVATHRQNISDLEKMQDEMSKTAQKAEGLRNAINAYKSAGKSDTEINQIFGYNATQALDNYDNALKQVTASSDNAKQGSSDFANSLDQVANQAEAAGDSVDKLKKKFDNFASEAKVIQDAMKEFKETGGLSESTISNILGTGDNELIASLGNVNTMMDVMKRKLGEVNTAKENAYHQAVNQAMASEGQETNISLQGANNRKQIAQNEVGSKSNSYNNDVNNFSNSENEKNRTATEGTNSRSGIAQNEANNNSSAYSNDVNNHANAENTKSTNASNTGGFISNVYSSLMNFLGVNYNNDASNHANGENTKSNNSANTTNYISGRYTDMFNGLGVGYVNDTNNHANGENIKSVNSSNTSNYIYGRYTDLFNGLGVGYGTDSANHANAEGAKGNNASSTSNFILGRYTDAINGLGGVYGTDATNHGNAENTKGQNTAGLVNSVSGMYGSMTNNLGGAYRTDVSNYNGSLNSKLRSTSEYVAQVGKMFNSLHPLIAQQEKWQQSKDKLNNITKGVGGRVGPRADGETDLKPDTSYAAISRNYTPIKPSTKSSSYTPKRSSYKPKGSSYKPKSSSYKPTNKSYKPTKTNKTPSDKISTSKGGKNTTKDTTNIEGLDTQIDKYKALQDVIDNLNNALDQNKSLEDSANNRDKIKYMNQDIDLYKKKKTAIDNLIKAKQGEARQLEKELRSKGLNARNGQIDNYTKALEDAKARVNKMSNKDKSKEKAKKDFEELKNAADRYFELTTSELPKLKKDWTNVDKDIKSTRESYLDLMAETEKDVTDIIKREVEKRKKAMEDETDKIKDELQKQKDLYDNTNKEEDYQEDLADKRKALNDINNKIDSVRRDTSAEGQAKLKEYLKEQEDAQKELNKTIRDKQRDDADKMFDNQIDMVSNQKDKIDKLFDEKYTDDKITELAKGMIQKGFVDIEGHVVKLKDAMNDYYKSQGEVFSNSANKMQEFIDKLEATKSLYSQLRGISKDLGINSVNSTAMTSISNPNIPKAISLVANKNKPTQNININTALNIGTLNEGNKADIQKMLDNNNKIIMNKIRDAVGTY